MHEIRYCYLFGAVIIVPEESPCYGMGSTCCLASEEKGMERVVELEHHRTLQSVLENRLQSCNKLGRITESK